MQSRSQNVAVQTDHQDECEDPGKQVLAKERENGVLIVFVHECLDNASIYKLI